MNELNNEEEIWKDISGFEGKYQISNFGRIKSLSREIRNKFSYYIKPEKIFNKYLNGEGYQIVKLYKGNKNFDNFHLHRLVASAFIPNPNNYLQVNHIDGHPSNNHVNNLEWCTNSQNTKHAYSIGLKDPKNYRGSANSSAKITEDVVLNIRKDKSNGLSYDELFQKYNLRKNHISLIINRRIWKHI